MALKVILIIALIIIIPQLYYLKKTNSYKAMEVGYKFFVRDKYKLEDHTELYLKNTDGMEIFVRLYEPETQPKAIIQLVHGMAEHSYNYTHFIEHFVKEGYVVVAHDHRGHGRSLSEKYPNGYMRLTEEIVDDTYMVNAYVREAYPDLDVYMLGHSMGSMVARLYLKNYDYTIEKLVLSGTVEPMGIAPIGGWLANFMNFYTGEYSPTKLSAFLPGGNVDDTWISYSEDNLERIRHDDFRIFHFTERYVGVIIDMNRKMGKASDYRILNPTLPILSITGAEDIVTGAEKGMNKTFDILKSAGYHDITNIVYEGMKHEVLNEHSNIKVYTDVLNFFES